MEIYEEGLDDNDLSHERKKYNKNKKEFVLGRYDYRYLTVS